MSRSFIYLCVFIGGLVGSYVPTWFGQGYFSAASIAGGALGSLAGVWAAIKLKDYFSS